MRLRKEFGAEPLTRPLVSSSGTPLLNSIQSWMFPRPRPNLPLGLRHSRAGFSSARRARRKVFRRSNGGDWTEGLTRNCLEHALPRRHYFVPSIFLQAQREVNDETRP